GQAVLIELQEDPLGPLVVLGIGGIHHPVPVKGVAQHMQLLGEVGNIVVGHLGRVDMIFDGVVLRGQAEGATAWRRWTPWQIWTRSSPNSTGAAPTRVRPSKGPGAGPARPSGPWSPRGGWTRGTSPPIMLIASTRRSWTPPEDESMTTEHLDP